MTTPHPIKQLKRNCECALWAHHNLTPFGSGRYTDKACPPAYSTGEKPSPKTMESYLKQTEEYWEKILQSCSEIELAITRINHMFAHKDSYLSDEIQNTKNK